MSISADSDGAPAGPFTIVGVGASAGGLVATCELLTHLGPAPGIALVVVHHLDPSHESSLTEILSRSAAMAVSTASDGLQVEPNHVYVLPSNAGILIEDGLLVLTQRFEHAGVHLPVDQFFESLATHSGNYAAGVLLSGNGSDGTRGLSAIRQGGGHTFVQDDSAQYRSMPESAFAAGSVDFVRSPAGIASELLRLARRGALSHPSPGGDPEDDAEPDFMRLLTCLRKASGVDLRNYKRGTIRRRARRRMFLHRSLTLAEYVELLERDPSEAKALSEEVLIHVTSFFRDAATFLALKELVFAPLLAHQNREGPIRIWVPGCSTGEEVYSLAIALLEFLADNGAADVPIKVFGTDLSALAIDRARAGKYPPSIERDVSAGRLQRFFTRTGDVLQIHKDLRDRCVFAQHDITRDPPFSRMDLVSCRNLMIYLGTALQDRVLPVFHYALRTPGFLLLGSSETTRSYPGFATVDSKHKVYVRTQDGTPRLNFDFIETGLRGPVGPHALATHHQPPPFDVLKEADRLVLAEFAPPGVVITDELAIVQFRGAIAPYLEPAPGKASLELMRMLKEGLRLPARRAIDDARNKQGAAQITGLLGGAGTSQESVTIEAIPFVTTPEQRRFFVVLFRERSPAPSLAAPEARERPQTSVPSVEGELRRELDSTRDYLQSVVEQVEASNEELRAANEEVVSSNEELRSTNEELQTAKEELQATNEELRTLNDEMGVRNAESRRLTDDLSNVLSSVGTPIMILGRDSRIRRFTAAATKLFHLVATDVGRPLSDIKALIDAPDLGQVMVDVLEQLRPIERTVQDHEGRWYQLTVRPYMTLDNHIDGTLLVAFDVNERKRAELQLSEAQRYAESIVDSVRECLLVVDRRLRVRSANRTFYAALRLSPEEVEGRPVQTLFQGELGLSNLAAPLAALAVGTPFAEQRVEVGSLDGGQVFLMSGNEVEGTNWLLLALEDVTERERLALALRTSEIRFHDVLATASESILMTNAQGEILFANAAAAALFGYEVSELRGLSVDRLVPEETRSVHAAHRAAYLEAPTPRRLGPARNLMGQRKDGARVPIDVSLNVMEQEEGPLVVSFVRDMTEKHESERSIREYQKKLQNLAFERSTSEERERRRIAIELHDQIGQALALAQIKLTGIRDTLEGSAKAAVADAVQLLQQSVLDTRSLTFELSPPMLYDLGLKETLAWLAEQFEKDHKLQVTVVDDQLDKPLDQVTAALIFRAVRELLINVAKHAHSSSARVSLRRVDHDFEVTVDDAGVGFDPPSGRSAPHGFGLFSVREQVDRLGGNFELTTAKEHGTRVKLTIPLRIKAPAGSAEREGT